MNFSPKLRNFQEQRCEDLLDFTHPLRHRRTPAESCVEDTRPSQSRNPEWNKSDRGETRTIPRGADSCLEVRSGPRRSSGETASSPSERGPQGVRGERRGRFLSQCKESAGGWTSAGEQLHKVSGLETQKVREHLQTTVLGGHRC